MVDNELERVARALHDDACADDDCGGGDLGEYERQAEIAIAALTPAPHGPVMSWRNDGGPWHEGSKCPLQILRVGCRGHGGDCECPCVLTLHGRLLIVATMLCPILSLEVKARLNHGVSGPL